MKKLCFGVCVVAIIVLLPMSKVFSQKEFKGNKTTTSKEEDAKLKESFKAQKVFEIDFSEIKNHVYSAKRSRTPKQFTLDVEGEKFSFTLFENDILSDDFALIENGKVVGRKPKEISTYAGYYGDNPKNALRFSISDDRFAGFFQTEKGEYTFGPITDYKVKDNNGNKNRRVAIAKTEDLISAVDGMLCGNMFGSKPASPKRVGATEKTLDLTCKYIKLGLATDFQYYQSEWFYANQANVYTTLGRILDMVNRMEHVMLYNTKKLGITTAPLGLRLQLAALDIRTTAGYPYLVTSTTGSDILNEFTSRNIFAGYDVNVSHLLSGRAMGASGFGDQFGQSNHSTMCSTSSSATSCSTIKVLSTGAFFPTYQDVWTTMLHEISHVMGASSDFPANTAACPSGDMSLMCNGPGKSAYYSQQSINEIVSYLSSSANSSCIDGNTALPGYSNKFSLQLNGNTINSTPLFINSGAKILSIPPDPNTPLLSSNFSANDSRVYFYYKNLSNARFEIRTAPQFQMAVTAQNQCNYMYWGLPFVYSPSGARVGFGVYPNPADESIQLEPVENVLDIDDDLKITSVKIYDSKSDLIKDVPVTGQKFNELVVTSDLKSGVYYLHIIHKDGTADKKRIIIKR